MDLVRGARAPGDHQPGRVRRSPSTRQSQRTLTPGGARHHRAPGRQARLPLPRAAALRHLRASHVGQPPPPDHLLLLPALPPASQGHPGRSPAARVPQPAAPERHPAAIPCQRSVQHRTRRLLASMPRSRRQARADRARQGARPRDRSRDRRSRTTPHSPAAQPRSRRRHPGAAPPSRPARRRTRRRHCRTTPARGRARPGVGHRGAHVSRRRPIARPAAAPRQLACRGAPRRTTAAPRIAPTRHRVPASRGRRRRLRDPPRTRRPGSAATRGGLVGAPGRTRTCDQLLRRQSLCPAELRGQSRGRKASAPSPAGEVSWPGGRGRRSPPRGGAAWTAPCARSGGCARGSG